MNFIPWLAILLLAQSLSAQQIATEATTRNALSGLVNPEQIGDLFLVDEASRPQLQPVGIIRINEGATRVSVSAFRVLDGKWDLISARELKPLWFAIEKSGNWMVAVRGDGVVGEPFFNLVVGPVIKPPPVDPPPPIGDFAALAAHSKQLAAALNDPATASAIATRLEVLIAVPNPDLLSARKSVSVVIEQLLLARVSRVESRNKNWSAQWLMPLRADLESLAAAGKFPTTTEYFRAIKALVESLK